MAASRAIVALILVSLQLPILFAPARASSDNEGWQTHYAVNGFVNVGPPDPYQIFKIQYRVINGTAGDAALPHYDLTPTMRVYVNTDSQGTLEIRFPKNYPSYEGSRPTDAIFFLNELEVTGEHYGNDDCFIDFRIPFNQSGFIDVVWTTIFGNEIFTGIGVPEHCISETLVQDVVRTKDGVIAPLHQVKAGVKPEEVVCADGFEFIYRPDSRPYCATPNSAERLYNQWKILPPPGPPAAQYPLLSNVTSFISTPFAIIQNQRTPAEFRVQNDNDR